tara:strand:+ start:205 stop:1410 length:1206 start_codon:yes stop_codon:yes gene_type:complete
MNEIQVNISSKNFNKMISYARKTYEKHKTEVSGYAPVYINEEGVMDIQEPVIMDQECSSTNTTLKKEAISEYISKVSIEEKDKLPNNLMFMWWHSHHTMEAFWSSTDIEAINEFAENGPALSVVVNNKGEYKADYSMKVEINKHCKKIVHFDIDLNIDHGNKMDLISEEIEKCVKVARLSSSNNIMQTDFFSSSLLNGYGLQKDYEEYADGMGEEADPEMEDYDDYLLKRKIRMMDDGIIQSDDAQLNLLEVENENQLSFLEETPLKPDDDFPFKPEPVPGTDVEEKPKKKKKVQRVSTLVNTTIMNEGDLRLQKIKIISNINNCIQSWQLEPTEYISGDTTHLQYVNELIKVLKDVHGMILHVPSSLEDLSSFNDLIVNDNNNRGDYESAYSEISKHISN